MLHTFKKKQRKLKSKFLRKGVLKFSFRIYFQRFFKLSKLLSAGRILRGFVLYYLDLEYYSIFTYSVQCFSKSWGGTSVKLQA